MPEVRKATESSTARQKLASLCLNAYAELRVAAADVLRDEPRCAQLLSATWPERGPRVRAALQRLAVGDTDCFDELAIALATPGVQLRTWARLQSHAVAPVLALAEPAGTTSVEALRQGLLEQQRELTTLLAEVGAVGERSNSADQARYRRLSQAGVMGIVVLDERLQPIEVNDTLLQMVGYTRAELLAPGFRFTEITPPEWHASDQAAAAQLESEGLTTLREKEYIRKDGSRIPVLAGSARVAEANGGIIGFILDIRERKRADAVIRQLAHERAVEARFRQLLEGSPDGIVIFDRDGQVLLVNARTESLFGYARDELVGHSVDQLMSSTSRADAAQRRARFFRSPEVALRRVLEGRRRDGREFPMEICISPLESPDGMLVMGTIRDVSERFRVEAALEASAAQLAATNRELETFSYSVAHDLRAPLRGMAGFAQILIKDCGHRLDDEARECLREIDANAQRMGALIDALLALSRVTRSEFRRARVDLSALARTVGAQLAAHEPERRVELVVPDGLYATMDPPLARTLLENLLGNAWKFTLHSAAPRVELGCTSNGDQPVFFVRDNGAGFDMTYAQKLFTPFQRLHTPQEFPGTGIGLASVERIINRHGGHIWAQAEVGRGATLSFTLPPSTGERA